MVKKKNIYKNPCNTGLKNFVRKLTTFFFWLARQRMSTPTPTPPCYTPTNECCKRVLKRLARDLFMNASNEPQPARLRPVLPSLDTFTEEEDFLDGDTTEEGCEEEAEAEAEAVVLQRPPARAPLTLHTSMDTEASITTTSATQPNVSVLAKAEAPRAIRSGKRRLLAGKYTLPRPTAAAKKLRRCVAFPDQQDIGFSAHVDGKKARTQTRTADPCVVLRTLELDPGSHCLVDVTTDIVKTYRKSTPRAQRFQFTVMYPDGSQKEHQMMGREFRSTFAIAPELVIADMKMVPKTRRQPYMKLRSRQL